MPTPLPAFEETTGPTFSNSQGVGGVILPAGAYDEPVFLDKVLPAGVWVLVATRDIMRGLFSIQRFPGVTTLQLRPGGTDMAVPFQVDQNAAIFSLRYIDFLTIVTGDWWANSAAGEIVTVATVRLH